MFVARRRLLGLSDPLYGWGDIPTGGVELYELPVNPRGSLIEPYVEELARKLTEVISKSLLEQA